VAIVADPEAREEARAAFRAAGDVGRAMLPRLAALLDRYAALHAQTYGEAVDAATLIPHMLEAFMAGDRGFRRVTGR
jgi:hypothetical protein